MQSFSFEKTELDGLCLIKPFLAEDNRGFFLKSYEKEIFKINGIETDIFETFESLSKKGVIRGLHFQTENPQSKLVRCVAGKVFDVAVDLRKGSVTYGKWYGEYLGSDNHLQLFVPQGFAHGFLSLTDNSVVSYTCSGKYSKGSDSGIVWNDKRIGIKWPLCGGYDIIISQRDSELQTFEEFDRNNHF